jgi:hypothetical protein
VDGGVDEAMVAEAVTAAGEEAAEGFVGEGEETAAATATAGGDSGEETATDTEGTTGKKITSSSFRESISL